MVQIDLVPSDIRFMHNCISNKFSNGILVNDTIDDIENGYMSVDDLPRIKVVHKDGNYYSFDNRRLYVFRVLHYRGCLNKVTVKLASIKQFQPWRFTTKNNGKTVIVNRDITYKHSGLKLDSNIVNESSVQEDSESDEDDDDTDDVNHDNSGDVDDENTDTEDVDDDNTTSAQSFITRYLSRLEKLRLIQDAKRSCKSDEERSSRSSLTNSSQRNPFSSAQSSKSIHTSISTESPSLWQPGTSSCLARNHSGDTLNRSAQVESWRSSRSDVNHETYSPWWQTGESNYNRKDSSDTWNTTAQDGRSYAHNHQGDTWNRSAQVESRRSSMSDVNHETYSPWWQTGESNYNRKDSSDTWSTTAQDGRSYAHNHQGDTWNRSAQVESRRSSRSNVNHETYSPWWQTGESNYNRKDSSDTWSTTAQDGRSYAHNHQGDTWSRSAQVESRRSSRNPVRNGTDIVSHGSLRRIDGSSRAQIDSSDAWSTIAQVGGWRSSKNPTRSSATRVSNPSPWQTGSRPTSSLSTRSRVSGSISTTYHEHNSYRVYLESRSKEPFVSLSDRYDNNFKSASPPKSEEGSWCTIS